MFDPFSDSSKRFSVLGMRISVPLAHKVRIAVAPTSENGETNHQTPLVKSLFPSKSVVHSTRTKYDSSTFTVFFTRSRVYNPDESGDVVFVKLNRRERVVSISYSSIGSS